MANASSMNSGRCHNQAMTMPVNRQGLGQILAIGTVSEGSIEININVAVYSTKPDQSSCKHLYIAIVKTSSAVYTRLPEASDFPYPLLT